MIARVAIATAVVAASLASGCGDDGPAEPLLVRSCRGEAVPNCRAYEYARVVEASLLPDRLPVADPSMDAMIHARLETCGAMAPSAAEVTVQLLASRGSGLLDGGSSLMLFTLATARDDGTGGDPTARDGVVDVTIGNPLVDAIPGDANVTLRFTPRTGATCTGEPLEVPYRTGPAM